ncbi:NAD(P)H-quinone oxidoreductase [Demequina sp. SYSU T00039]|uniref:NAD(P)H-quinone oxidoreductase n=1 Tax=Demequina lignilytica TaxID=3051663 RepID=A0AAW7M891_9MICO|nr:MULTISPECIES: NAD(P)H-quinone oxidoreductase [unclassified Demequina]MDN4477696.1 NAD(P)H-quinone oxidoreductase [Demequina sp. SYSU T00039-1]MDN4487605.1 NAD(P)H-quinone oxidoreductase [Demequina sp. SYSU T00039]
MRAAVVSDSGDDAAFSLLERPDPRCGPDDAVMRITAAGVNRADILQRRGLYPPPPGAPEWPGLEAAGTVAEVGAAVTGWRPGDRACALLPGGGYAERVAVDASLLLPVPAGVTDVEAASLVEAACTVVSNLDAAGARAGETLLVHGGSGGVGTAAIQIAKARGMRVIATAGGAARAGRCAALGADHALDHRAGGWVDEVRALGGADVILDVVGAAYLADNVRALRTGGRLVVIGLQKGARAELDLGALLTKRATLLGTTLRARPLAERAAIVARVRDEVWPLVPRIVRPVVHATFPLAHAGDAHAALESGEVFGKVVLTVP